MRNPILDKQGNANQDNGARRIGSLASCKDGRSYMEVVLKEVNRELTHKDCNKNRGKVVNIKREGENIKDEENKPR